MFNYDKYDKRARDAQQRIYDIREMNLDRTFERDKCEDTIKKALETNDITNKGNKFILGLIGVCSITFIIDNLLNKFSKNERSHERAARDLQCMYLETRDYYIDRRDDEDK